MKKQAQSLFLIFTLILLIGLVEANHVFQRHFSGETALVEKVSRLEKNVEKEKLKLSLAQNQLIDFQSEIAQYVDKGDLKSLADAQYKKKNILSTLRLPASTSEIDMSSAVMSRGKDDFIKNKYLSAIESFKEIVRKYPSSPQVIEANFMLAESYFLAQKPEDCLDVVDKMMIHYPDHDLTGFIMLRMGQILQSRKRSVEAVRVYQIIIEKFKKNEILTKQARELLKSTEV